MKRCSVMWSGSWRIVWVRRRTAEWIISYNSSTFILTNEWTHLFHVSKFNRGPTVTGETTFNTKSYDNVEVHFM